MPDWDVWVRTSLRAFIGIVAFILVELQLSRAYGNVDNTFIVVCMLLCFANCVPTLPSTPDLRPAEPFWETMMRMVSDGKAIHGYRIRIRQTPFTAKVAPHHGLHDQARGYRTPQF
ncbi:hypothetical protein Tco_1285886 [Tanacetum coccineum]